MGLGVVVPMAAALAGMASDTAGPDVLTMGQVAGFFVWTAVLVAALTGLTYRRFWGILLGWSVGAVLAVAYPLTLAATARLLLSPSVPGLDRFPVWLALGWLTLVAPAYVALCRMLALRYWQPWRRPEEWEPPGDGRVPVWMLVVLDYTRPWLADEIRRQRGLPDPPPTRWRGVVAWVVAGLVILRLGLLIFG